MGAQDVSCRKALLSEPEQFGWDKELLQEYRED
jgi:hypothetical protein